MLKLSAFTEWFHSLGGDLAEEDAKFAAFLEANGWSGEVGASESIDDLVAATEKGEKSGY
jgi:hypothetical protein